MTDTGFEQWIGPGTPQFTVTFNQRMAADAVRTHLFFETDAGARVPLEVELARSDVEEPERHWRVRPARELPPGSTAHLTAEKGLTSMEGPLPVQENNRVVSISTFPAHAFLGIRCYDNQDEEITIRPSDALPSRPCNPMNSVEVLFAAPIVKEVLRDHLKLEPDLAGGREDYDPWDAVYSYSRLEWPRSEGEVYSTRLPELLRARSTYRIQAEGGALLDEFGRPLPQDIDFVFTTSDRPPRAGLTHPISTLEKNIDTRVPIVVTNLEGLDFQVEGLTADGLFTANEAIELPDAPNVAFRHPLPSREWLKGRSGALFANVLTRPPTVSYENRLFTQVTPFAVHTKLGHQNTAVWVTDMATGLPVEGASVFIYRTEPESALRERAPLSSAVTDAAGVALLAGQAELNPLLETQRWNSLTHSGDGESFFVSVEKEGELALAPLSSDFWVYIEGANNTWIPSYTRTRYGHVRAWGTTAQGVYRLGDTIQYKLYVRDQDNERFVKAPKGSYHLQVLDPMEKVVHEETDVELNDFGALDGELRVAESGAVGWYRFQLQSSFYNETWEPLRVLVADFTPAPFRVTTDLDGERYEPGDEIRVATSAKLHSGGPYADADSRVTVNVTPASVVSENPKAAGFWFGSGYGETVTVHQSEAPVDGEGELETVVPVLDQSFPRGRMLIESAVRDDRGKYIAGRASAEYLGRDRFVGIRQEGWLLKAGEASEVQAIVIDTKDEVASGTEVTFRIQYRETTASRVKGAGNAYITQYNHAWVDVATCAAVSAAEPSRCAFTPEKPGYYQISASILDSKNRSYEVSTSRWAAGKGQVLWEESPGHRLDIEPEKKEYRVGETARFLVRNPFPGAKALVTIERYGVQKHWLETFEESTEVIEVQVGEDHVPGFYLSAVVTSPRVEAPPSEDDLDLGKPAFRMGYVQVPVLDPVKEIVVEVHPEKDLYKPRDKVKVELKARPRLWASTSLPPMELAVAVLDEAVFDLIGGGDSYFDPYRGFYSLEPLDVENFNLLTRLIGIQKFEKKGANPGGDGGGGPDLRTLFKFVSYWNPALVPDAEGRATIEFEVPDNLTGWRILTMAVTSEDRMGLGQGHFVVNRPTEIRPALPNQVIEGDRFDARFTVMNRTEEIRTLTVTAEVSGAATSEGLAAREIEAEPYRRYDVSFPVRTTGVGEVVFTVRASDPRGRRCAPTSARRRTTRGSRGRRHVRHHSRSQHARVLPLSREHEDRRGKGERRLERDGPRKPRGRLRVPARLSLYLLGAEADQSGHGLALRVASRLRSQRLYLARTRGASAMRRSPSRRTIKRPTEAWSTSCPRTTTRAPTSAPTPLSLSTGFANEATRFRRRSRPGSTSTCASSFAPTSSRISTPAACLRACEPWRSRRSRSGARSRKRTSSATALTRSEMDLFGKAHFVMAANALGVDARAVEDSILAHSSRSGGKIVFTESIDDDYTRILHSPERTECAVLSALTRRASRPEGDLPFELTRTITQSRGRRDRWENTQENVFCMNALIDYSRLYESEAPSFTLRTFFDGDALGESTFDDRRDPPVEHERALRPTDPGKSGQLRLSKLGPGRLYYSARLFYSPKELKTEPVNAGVEIRREYSVKRGGEWVLLQEPMRIAAGELVKVDLFLSLPAPRNFLVVDDPVPGGLEPVNRDLATASTVDADEGGVPGRVDVLLVHPRRLVPLRLLEVELLPSGAPSRGGAVLLRVASRGELPSFLCRAGHCPRRVPGASLPRGGDVRPRRLRTGRPPDARGRGETLTRKLALLAGAAGAALIAATALSLSPVPALLPPVDGGAVEPRYVDRAGELLSVTYENPWNLHERIALHETPTILTEAFVTAEDKRFYRHHGVDWTARLHAAWMNLVALRPVRGASTITEQVVRMIHPRPRTLWSRWVEGFEATRLERRFEKAEILEFYLNQVPYARNRRGVRQAAREYFDRDVDTLTPKESLALAVLVRSPSRLDLKKGTEAIDRPVRILAARLHAKGVLSDSELDRIETDTIAVTPAELRIDAAHFVPARSSRRRLIGRDDSRRLAPEARPAPPRPADRFSRRARRRRRSGPGGGPRDRRDPGLGERRRLHPGRGRTDRHGHRAAPAGVDLETLPLRARSRTWLDGRDRARGRAAHGSGRDRTPQLPQLQPSLLRAYPPPRGPGKLAERARDQDRSVHGTSGASRAAEAARGDEPDGAPGLLWRRSRSRKRGAEPLRAGLGVRGPRARRSQETLKWKRDEGIAFNEDRVLSPETASLIADILSDPEARALEFGRSSVLTPSASNRSQDRNFERLPRRLDRRLHSPVYRRRLDGKPGPETDA